MKAFRSSNLLWVMVMFAAVSCENKNPSAPEQDVAKPVIKVAGTTPAAGKGIICKHEEDQVILVGSGGELALRLNFADDQDLSQYKIDIHNNFDCHSHGRLMGTSWQLQKIVKLTGAQQQVTETIQVPADAMAGDYHLQVLCLDAVGNEAEPVIFSVKLTSQQDDILPELILNVPATGLKIKRSSTLVFSGNLTDNIALTGGKIEIVYSDPSGKVFAPIQQVIAGTTAKAYAFNLSFPVPASALIGKHIFTVKGFDAINNSVEKQVEVIFE